MPRMATFREASTLRTKLTRGGGGLAEGLTPWVSGYLEQVAAGERVTAAKLHPLGFHCIPVYRSDEFGLCVHGWLPGARRADSPTSDIHMHSFDTISAVLAGNVINKELKLVDVGPERYRIFEIRKDGERGDADVDVFSDTGLETAIEDREVVNVAAGQTYSVERFVYHSADETVRSEDCAVTLMLAEHWDASPQRTLVKASRADAVPRRYERTMLSEAATRRAATDILNLLSRDW